MELNPTFLLTIVLAVLAGVAWLIRLESKTNTSLSDLNDLYRKVDEHSSDREIHHDGEELNRRFNDIGRELSEIKVAVKEGMQNLSNRIDNFLKK